MSARCCRRWPCPVWNLDRYSSLAVTQRVDADVLVVEGWVHPMPSRPQQPSSDTAPIADYYHGRPCRRQGRVHHDYNTAASVGADLLKKTDVPTELIKMGRPDCS